MSTSANANVKKVLRKIIPSVAYKKTRVTWQPTGLGKYRVLRIVTPAWKSLPRFDRILKVQKAINAQLPAKEIENILRVSVLTADEYKKLHPTLLAHRSYRTRRVRHANGK